MTGDRLMLCARLGLLLANLDRQQPRDRRYPLDGDDFRLLEDAMVALRQANDELLHLRGRVLGLESTNEKMTRRLASVSMCLLSRPASFLAGDTLFADASDAAKARAHDMARSAMVDELPDDRLELELKRWMRDFDAKEKRTIP